MWSQEYRPFSFDDMIGNKGILNEMRKRSESLDFPEVMLFAGPSGTGKTTLALIIAALINESNPLKVRGKQYLNPNHDSVSSKNIIEEKFNRDVHFYDASVMGKDDVVKLESIVSTAPMFDRKKVVIIDEAQELTKAGKGVTLKLLEKKRKNAHIILCTMNIDAFDKAVKTRGQLYTFRSPSSSEISEYLFSIVEKTNIEPPDEFFESGIFTIAENCEGSVRYAVQNLERCLIGEFYTEEQIALELGFLSTDTLGKLILKILQKDSSVIPEIINFSSKEFYYKARKTLIDTAVYLNTGYLSADWKKGLAEKIKKHDYSDLIATFFQISNDVYFKEDIFIYYLSEFMKNKKVSTRVVINDSKVV